MKPLLRLIKGGKPPKMKFASFGRERDLEMIEKWVTDPALKARWLKQTAAAHDLNDGLGTLEQFIEASREAILPASFASRDTGLTLLFRISRYYPDCLVILDELAKSKAWRDRFTVACYIYSDIAESESDRFFNVLRNDKSKRVRDMAIGRYKHRSNENGEIVFDKYDPECFDERIRRGEVKI